MIWGSSFSGEAGIALYPSQPSLAQLWSVHSHHSRMDYPSVAPAKKLGTSPSFLYTESALKNHISLLKLKFFNCLPPPQRKQNKTKKQAHRKAKGYSFPKLMQFLFGLSFVLDYLHWEITCWNWSSEYISRVPSDSIGGENILLFALYKLFLRGMDLNSL